MRETLPVLYQDEWLIAVHKPSGLLVHRSDIDRHETRFAVQILREQIGRHVYPVHRLDKGTSGILLFALDREMARQVGMQFELQQVVKTYLAVVRGWPQEFGTIDHPLARIVDAYASSPGDGEAQTAVTRYRRLATCELPCRVDRYPSSRYALMALEPLTGRRHQLRRHLKHIAHPIIGDATYGKGRHNRLFQDLFGSCRLLLASIELRMNHPVKEDELVIKAPLAADFASVAQQMGLDAALVN